MGRIPFGLLEEPETRRPSKVRVTFMLLFIVLLALSITFLALYIVERNKSAESTSKTGGQNGTVIPTASNTTVKPTTTPSHSNETCNSPACIISAADILSKLDQSTKPCDDFYQFSCGQYLKNTFIPEDKSFVDSFTAAIDKVQYRLRNILGNEQLMSNYSKNSAVLKAFSFYTSCMDDTSINNAGLKPIRDVIEKHGSWNITNSNWSSESWKLESILGRALAEIEISAFIKLNVQPYVFNTSEWLVTISVGNIGYQQVYVENERSHSKLLKKRLEAQEFVKHKKDYKKFMSTVFKLLKSNASIDEEVNRISDLENEFMNKTRKADVNAVKLMTINELNNFTSNEFNWTLYFEEVLRDTNKPIPSNLTLMILLPDNLKEIVHWLNGQSKSLLANEIIWQIIVQLSDALPLKFREAKGNYAKTFSGLTTPRWKACNRFTDVFFPFATTLLYVNQHLPKDARKTAGDMFTEVKSQFIDGLEEQMWMDNKTRAQARLKLNKMTKWIGFPEFIKDPVNLSKYYENIHVDESQFLISSLSVLKDRVRKNIDKLDKPPQRSRFTGPDLTPLSVNAFYSPDLNAMTVLVGILQAPFYKEGRLKALNYGSLGMVVGHEITHGFDKQGAVRIGSEYDENGNIRNWWTNTSRDNFVKRSKCLIEEYNNVTIFGYKVNGTKTLSENIADNGGLKYAYRAYQKWRAIHGNEAMLPALPYNNNQLFFIGFAQQWCAKFKKEGAKRRMDTDTHSLDPVRVRVPLHNFAEFSKAFGCPLPKKTCAVW